MGPKTRKFRPIEIANFCGRLFICADLQKFKFCRWLDKFTVYFATEMIDAFPSTIGKSRL